MGQTPSIVEACKKAGTPVTADSCKITFDASGKNVVSFGGMQQGQFEGDADIAGVGVFFAFVSLSVMVCSIGLLFALLRVLSLLFSFFRSKPLRFITAMNRSNKLHDLVDDLLLSCGDAQLLLILAFGGSFYSTSQCSVSLYHYFVAFHMVIIGISTALLTFVLVRSPYKTYFSSLARLVILAVCFYGVWHSKDTINQDDDKFKAVISLPTTGQPDSLIVLPTYCILEDSINPFTNLTIGEKRLLTNAGVKRNIISQVLALLVIYIIMTVVTVFGIRWRDTFAQGSGDGATLADMDDEREKMAGKRFYISAVVKFVIWSACLVLIIWNWVIIQVLRNWIDASVWLNKEEGNPENDVKSIGQLAPLAALGVVGFTFLNGCWRFARRWRCFRHFTDDGEDNDNSGVRNSTLLEHVIGRKYTKQSPSSV